jgi:hypothetical protein
MNSIWLWLMLFQDVFIQRLLIIALFQTWPIVYDLYLANKLLKRSKNPLTFIIATYFVMYPAAFILRYPSIFVIPISANLAYLFYFIAWFFFILSQGFLVIFSWQLNKLADPINYKQTIPWIILNLIISSFAIWAGFIFKGIRYDASTNWIPVFSMQFAIISIIIVSLFLVLPHTILSFQLLKSFQGEVRKRITRYILSVYLEFVVVYVLIFYNTFVDNPVIEVLNLTISVPASLLSAYFIYKSFVESLG